jgi:hypothetical protein
MRQITERLRMLARLQPMGSGSIRPVPNGPLLLIRICPDCCVIYEITGKGRNLNCRHRVVVQHSDRSDGGRIPSAADIRTALKQSGIKTRNAVWILPEAAVRHSAFALPPSTDTEECAAAELVADERFGDSITDLQMIVHKVSTESAKQALYSVHVMSGEVLSEIREVSETLKLKCRGIFPAEIPGILHAEDLTTKSAVTCALSFQDDTLCISVFLGNNLIAAHSRVTSADTPDRDKSQLVAGEIRRTLLATRKYTPASVKVGFIVVSDSALSDELLQLMEEEFHGTVHFFSPGECPIPVTPDSQHAADPPSAAEQRWLHDVCCSIRSRSSQKLNFIGKYKSRRPVTMRQKITAVGLVICLAIICWSLFRSTEDNSYLTRQLTAIQSEQTKLDDRLSKIMKSGNTAEQWQQWCDANTSSVHLLSDITDILSANQSIRVEQIDWSLAPTPDQFRTVIVTGTARHADNVLAINTEIKVIPNLVLEDCQLESMREIEKYEVRFTLHLRWHPEEPLQIQEDIYALETDSNVNAAPIPGVADQTKAPRS